MALALAADKPLEREAPVPGYYYPDRCLTCPEILSETYGCVGTQRCAECVAASLALGRIVEFAGR